MIKIFRRQADILDPSGTSGLDPIPGLQERNKRNLLDVLQAARPIIAEMAKVKPETWRSMSGLFTALEGTFGTGVRAIGQGFLRPANMLQNRLMNTFEGFLAPVMVGLNNIANQVESYALQNQQGATLGAISGGIIGAFIGHPALGAIFGSMLGSFLQQFTETAGFTDAEGNSFQLIPNYNEPFAGIATNPSLQLSAAEQTIVPTDRSFIPTRVNDPRIIARTTGRWTGGGIQQ